MVRIYLFAVSPNSLKIIEKAVFLIKNVNDHIAEIEKDPLSMLISLNLLENSAGFFHLLAHFVRQCLDLRTARTVRDNEIVCENRHLTS